ncbi:hypothetical protein DVH24_037388 [Malus domestica]|uniref:Ribulose-phosphate 3-epimerase n=1 Tax=Malus domestica TaxID=3750 RepID=A0A498HH10_MALDO|nr:hypothetical protein DVH24_037388 [Malus domestica]
MGVAAKIAPSMLSSDFANLASEAERMLKCGADWLHMDIMALCPEFNTRCSGHSEFEKAHKVTTLTLAYLDCHLMVTNPLDYVEPMGKAGASGFTFHVEASKDNWQELVQSIESKGMTPGVALKPGTPIEEVYPLVLLLSFFLSNLFSSCLLRKYFRMMLCYPQIEGENHVEMVLVMTVEPGFGGQKFMPEMMEKVRTLRQRYPSLAIEVDGGLGPSTIDMAASAGANCIVAGSSVFGAPEPATVISLLRSSVEGVQQKS